VLTRDHDGNLWIGTRNGGLVRYRNGQFSALTTNLFAASDLRSLLEDNEGSLWVGTYGVGLVRLRNGKFMAAGEPEGLQGNVTWTIAPRKNGGVWVGSDAGLSSYVNGKFDHVPGPRGHEHAPVRSVVEDSTGLWVGTEGCGRTAAR
jgi:ligand-binding sensor domain-containing protein